MPQVVNRYSFWRSKFRFFGQSTKKVENVVGPHLDGYETVIDLLVGYYQHLSFDVLRDEAAQRLPRSKHCSNAF
ncbi:hypothetical protein SH467x_003664 [Pirellulaceae bacterium SH467]